MLFECGMKVNFIINDSFNYRLEEHPLQLTFLLALLEMKFFACVSLLMLSAVHIH